MNKMSTERRAMVLTALAEGNSIAATCRMFGVNKVTVLRLLGDAGTLAADFHDQTVTNLPTKRVQMDEIWSFIYCKNSSINAKTWGNGHGDSWVWVAMDADTKLVINWLVGGRDKRYGGPFVADLANRLTDRVQLTSDGWSVYREAVARAFGTDVDYAQLVKEYDKAAEGYGRYSPPICVATRTTVMCGQPDEAHINTSYVERQNLTCRMQMRRFTRLTNGFSKTERNHKFAVALHYFNYNFVRKHQTIKTTPAVATGLTDKAWTMIDFVDLMEQQEEMLGGRISDYKPSKKLQ